MENIKNLEPKIVFSYFNDILFIPRPSKNEEKIISYLTEFAINNKLKYRKDDAGNIVIRKKASKGMENNMSIILQSHVDMVCEKNAEVVHDFLKDPIPAYIDGNWIKSKGTTLGADNGIGIALQLAILKDQSLMHGPIECLFTVDEETGLTGASELEEGMFTSRTLINLDSEDEGEIFIGCAGGIDTLIHMPLEYETSNEDTYFFEINLSGLKGGHSGDDINKGFANSNLLLIRYLWNISKSFEAQVSYFKGGNLRNAIPREAKAVFGVKSKKKNALEEYTDTFKQILVREYGTIENTLELTLTPSEKKAKVLTKKSNSLFLDSVYSCPNGVMAMSIDVPGLVETSTNLASIEFLDNVAKIVTSQRSSIETAKIDISNKVISSFSGTNAKFENTDSYPGWTPNPTSEILKIAVKSYGELFNQAPKVKAIHAGLECGLFLEKYPGLDMISIGPTLRGVHSPDERMEISTVKKTWDFLIQILESVPLA